MVEIVTKQEINQALSALGISKGSRLVVHSSLHSLGEIEGGAETMIDSLLESIGENGLLVMPTFSYTVNPFNPQTTPGKTGVLTELLRRRPNAVRSRHPSHSVTAIGDNAQELCSNHHKLPGLGKGSPLDLLARSGGGVLLLGVGHVNNSTVHVGEAYANAAYLDIPFDPAYPTKMTVEDNPPLELEIKNPPGCSRAFGAIEEELRRRHAIRDGKLGKGLIQWVGGEAVIDGTVALLKRNPSALLCTDPACYHCSHARQRIQALKR